MLPPPPDPRTVTSGSFFHLVFDLDNQNVTRKEPRSIRASSERNDVGGNADPGLVSLADSYGVETSYENVQGHRVEVDPEIIRAVLAVFDVDATSPHGVREALAEVRRRPERLPATIVVCPSEHWEWGRAVVYAEDGGIDNLDEAVDLP